MVITGLPLKYLYALRMKIDYSFLYTNVSERKENQLLEQILKSWHKPWHKH